MTHNADASDPATVPWHRIDNATSPTRFPSAIYVDPADTGHAWVTYSGYNFATPTTPGHVFDVRENGTTTPGSGTFTNLNVESSGTSNFPTPFSDGDLPVSDVVRDDANQTLYVSTDFGVLVGKNDGQAGWHVTEGHAAVRGHAPRAPALVEGADLRRERVIATASCTRRRTRRASGRWT